MLKGESFKNIQIEKWNTPMTRSSMISRLFALSVAGFFLAACDSENQTSQIPTAPRPAKVMVLENPAKTSDLIYSGQVRPGKVAELSFQVSGKLDKFPVGEGEIVKEGALIARLEQQDFQIRLREREALLREARQNLERARRLVAKGHVSRAVYDRRQSAYEVAKAQRDKARVDLNYTTLSAPYTGLIAITFAENFQRVDRGTPIVSIQDVDELEIHTDVPEAVFATVSEDDIAKIMASFEFAKDREFELQFKEASTEADPATKTFRVVFSMPAPKDIQILPGMTASVRAEIRSDNVVTRFLVPNSAVISDESGTFFTWVVDPTSDTVSKRPVKVGKLVGNKIFVLDGLKIGQRIVVAGAKFLRDGMAIKPVVAARDNL